MDVEKKLDRNNIENFMSLTSLQQGMLFHYINDEQSSMYHEQLSLSIKGDIKLELLRKSWQTIIENNEMLRTIFRWREIEQPIQVVLKKLEIPINYFDLTNEIDKENLIEEIKLNDLNSRIDITRETLRIYLCKLDENIHEMIISNHHIIYDGWSNGIILKELMEAYNYLYEGKDPNKTNKTKFSQFIKYLNSINKEDEKKYWSNYLENLESKDDCFSCKEVGTYKEISYKIDENKANKIKDFSKTNKILLSSILYGIWGVFLQKFNNSNEVLFGTTVSGRPENISSIDKMVGLFINTIPLRVRSNDKTTLIGLINDIDKSLNERKGFENTSLIDIKEYCGLKASEDIFNSIVTIENYPLDLNINKETVLSMQGFSIIEQTNYNMSLEILTFDGIEFKFNFNSLSINESIVKKLGSYLERIIENLLNNPNITIENIDLLSDQEKNQILYELNNTKVDYPKDKTIQELFEEQVEKTPSNIALIYGENYITYKELNDRANQLARYLVEKGVGANTLVGMMLEKSPEAVVSLMGILKAGGAYVPLDTEYPEERLISMIKEMDIKVLLTREELKHRISVNIADSICLDTEWEGISKKSSENLQCYHKLDNLIYAIYTSGSTGKPKGAGVYHRSFLNLLYWYKDEFNLNENDTNFLITSLSFDLTQKNIFTPLITGGRLNIQTSEYFDPNYIMEDICNKNITIINCTPSMFYKILELNENEIKKFQGLRYVILGGEPISISMLDKLVKSEYFKGKIINTYGPTECTDICAYYPINNPMMFIDKAVPIGKPIYNVQLYVLNKNRMVVPVNVPGELYISGDGVGKGYLNDLNLTKEKFINNHIEKCNGQLLYKTGDLVKWNEDGNLEFLSRIDQQVKIRGFRIETGEVETVLLKHHSVKDAVVIVKDDEKQNKYLCAYIVAEKEFPISELRTFLARKLPRYMIPAYFTRLDKIPLTINGKVDKKQLPIPSISTISITQYEKPKNEIEEVLVGIWQEVLSIDKPIGVKDDFFEIRGNSISALRIVNKVRNLFKVDMSVKQFFNHPNIREISEEILKLEKGCFVELEYVPEREYYPLSFNQKRLWIINRLNPESVAYNMPCYIRFNNEVSEKNIKKTIEKIVERHESFRTGFKLVNEDIMQYIKKEIDCPFEYINICNEDNSNKEKIVREIVCRQASIKFNLSEPPLFKAALIKVSSQCYDLIFVMHHIISDGWSIEILKKEFYEIYDAYEKNEEPPLESIQFRYRDFAVWQSKFINSPYYEERAHKFWLDKFKEDMPILKLPTDYITDECYSKSASYSCFVAEEIGNGLRKLSKKNKTSLFMVMFSAYNILLSQLTGENDIVCSVINGGREHEALNNIVGFFVNAIVVKTHIDYEEDFTELLQRVNVEFLETVKYASYPIERICEELNINYPAVNVGFNMHNTHNESRKTDISDVNAYHLDEIQETKYSLLFQIEEYKNMIKITCNYKKSFLNPNTIEYIVNAYIQFLNEIANDKHEEE